VHALLARGRGDFSLSDKVNGECSLDAEWEAILEPAKWSILKENLGVSPNNEEKKESFQKCIYPTTNEALASPIEWIVFRNLLHSTFNWASLSINVAICCSLSLIIRRIVSVNHTYKNVKG